MADALGIRIGATIPVMVTGNFSGATYDMSASNKQMAWVFQAQDTNAITHVGFNYSQKIGTPPTFRASIQGVSLSTGDPDGTIKGGGSPASGTFTPPNDSTWNGTFQWAALTNSYTPTRGELLAAVIDYSSGTINGSNFSFFNPYDNVSSPGGTTTLPYTTLYGGASWSKNGTTPVFGLRTASTRYGHIYKDTYNTATSSTVGNRAAMKFNIPATIASTYTIKGFRFVGKMASATGKSPIAGLWSAGGVLQNVTLDSDVASSPTTAYRAHDVFFDETSLSTLSGGTNYYIGLEVADASSGDMTLNGYAVTDANDLLAQPLGTSAFLSTYNGSAWSDTTTVRPSIELIIGDITNSGGGSSGLMFRRTFDGGIA